MSTIFPQALATRIALQNALKIVNSLALQGWAKGEERQFNHCFTMAWLYVLQQQAV